MPRIRFLGRMLVVLTALLAGGCRTPPEDPLGQVAEFDLVERSGRQVGLADLRGKVWVAGFVFTCCGSSCPHITRNMAQLQQDLIRYPDVVLVSFSVYPEHDSPEVLRDYAAQFQADPERWLFLTGPRDEIHGLVRDSFHLGVEPTTGPDRTPGNEVLHSSKLAVVDRRGQIRAYFDGTNADELAQLRKKVAALVREGP